MKLCEKVFLESWSMGILCMPLGTLLLIYARLELLGIKEPGCDGIAIENPPLESIDRLSKN